MARKADESFVRRNENSFIVQILFFNENRKYKQTHKLHSSRIQGNSYGKEEHPAKFLNGK